MKFKAERTYTIEEAAKILKVATNTVLKYIREGTIVGLSSNGKWSVSESALAEFFATPRPEFVNRVLPLLSSFKPKPKA